MQPERLPEDLYCRFSSLREREKIVYRWIQMMTNELGKFHFGNRKISKIVGLSGRALNNYFLKFETLGLIKRNKFTTHRRPNKSLYSIRDFDVIYRFDDNEDSLTQDTQALLSDKKERSIKGRRIKLLELLKKHGPFVSKEFLAKEMGVSITYIYVLLNGRYTNGKKSKVDKLSTLTDDSKVKNTFVKIKNACKISFNVELKDETINEIVNGLLGSKLVKYGEPYFIGTVCMAVANLKRSLIDKDGNLLNKDIVSQLNYGIYLEECKNDEIFKKM